METGRTASLRNLSPVDVDCFIDLICGPSGYFVLDFEVVTLN